MVRVLTRIASAEPLLIKKLAAETAQLVANGKKIISLAQGVPNLPLFDAAKESMKALIDRGLLPYTDVAGNVAPRQAAATFVNKVYFEGRALDNDDLSRSSASSSTSTSASVGLSFTHEDVIITAGAIQAVYNVLALSVDNTSDVVVSPLPAYGLYKHTTGLLGGTFAPILTGSDTSFVPTGEHLRDIFRQHTTIDPVTGISKCNIRSFVLCYPNNPVGAMLTANQAKEIADTLDELLQDPACGDGFSVILDEVYIGITSPDVEYYSVLHFASPRLVQSCFLIVSASKGLGAMPGARAGCLISKNRALLSEILKIQSATAANASIVSQEGLRASLAYVTENPSVFTDVYSHYSSRTSHAISRLNSISAKYFDGFVMAQQPKATFYVFANFSPLLSISNIKNDVELIEFFRDMCNKGAAQIGVACVPGSAFGLMPDAMFVRFSCAVDVEALMTAFDVIDEAISLLTSTNK